VAQGEYDRALEVILARNPLPAVTGYVCNHLCQTRCTRNDYEETVAIRALKRIAAERGRAGYAWRGRMANGGPAGGDAKKVAVIGSGPSGLSAAAFLALQGVKVTIFEAKDAPGGMMRVVPPFRLPWEIIQEDIDRITALGVEIKLNSPITVAPEELAQQGYDAVYIASGFQRDTPLHIPGVEGPGVMPALRLLDRSRRGEWVELGKRAVVVGGGDTAMDATRTARRFTGNPVTILYRRTSREMPAAEEELEGSLEEGNILEELVTPLRVLRDEAGAVIGIECLRNSLGEPGADGRREPVAIPGSEFVVPCDTVIVAVGQLPELAFLDGSSVLRHKGGGVVVDPTTGCAGPAGIYAGGDVVIKPDSIIAACADGRTAAEAICEHFCIPFHQPPAEMPVLSEGDILAQKHVRARKIAQVKPAMVPAAERIDLRLIEKVYTEEEARIEGLRCVQCTAFCDKCVEVCPNRANFTFYMEPVSGELPVIGVVDGKPGVVGTEPFRVAQARQILHVDDWCNECDDCQTFCVHHGLPYRDKPRLFLDEGGFRAEQDNAWMIRGDSIYRRENGRETSLHLRNGHMLYETPEIDVTLTREFAVVHVNWRGRLEGTLSLRDAAEMAVVHKGVNASLAFLTVV